ncbi:MAG: hypothetical protein M3388_17595 [Acidobacteriota bacterium]|nr:hypothetical protein [Acidobacteriota bacterium]
MYNCEIEFANLNVSWRFSSMASQLPAPGSEAFGMLVKGLRPFEITARSINLESPSSNLDDVAITITLLKPRINLRIAYSGIDIEARDVEDEEVEQIIQILNLTFQSLEKIDSEFKDGNGNVKISLHIKLIDKNVSEYISEKVSIKLNDLTVKPEATVFSLDFDELTKQYPTKVTIAGSLAVKNGLFLEINYQSKNSAEDGKIGEPIEFFQNLGEHYQTIFSLLELKPIVEEESL